jgi:hypothetical protein
MANAETDDLIAALSRDAVASCAPQEMALFDPLSKAYFANPARIAKGGVGKDEALGFGVAESVVFMTPIALSVMSTVLKYLADHVLQTIKEESSGLASDAVRKLFKRFRTGTDHDTPAKGLTSEQIAAVRRVAFEKAHQLELPDMQANLLADAVAGSLVCATDEKG